VTLTQAGPEEHPIGAETSPGESFAHVESPGTPPFEDSPPTRRQTRSSSRTDLNEDFAETVEAEDTSDGAKEDTEDDQNNSDPDAKMGHDDESTSNWDLATDYGQRPESSSSLVYLGMLHCRVPTQVKAKNGSKVSCVCGKLQAGCKWHEEKISQGAYHGQKLLHSHE
jgi:hypothetical protein